MKRAALEQPKAWYFTTYWLAWLTLCAVAWFVPGWSMVPILIALFALGEAPGVYLGNGRSLSSKFWQALGYGRLSDRKPWAYAAIWFICWMLFGAALSYQGLDVNWMKDVAAAGVFLCLGEWLLLHWSSHYGQRG